MDSFKYVSNFALNTLDLKPSDAKSLPWEMNNEQHTNSDRE